MQVLQNAGGTRAPFCLYSVACLVDFCAILVYGRMGGLVMNLEFESWESPKNISTTAAFPCHPWLTSSPCRRCLRTFSHSACEREPIGPDDLDVAACCRGPQIWMNHDIHQSPNVLFVSQDFMFDHSTFQWSHVVSCVEGTSKLYNLKLVLHIEASFLASVLSSVQDVSTLSLGESFGWNVPIYELWKQRHLVSLCRASPDSKA